MISVSRRKPPEMRARATEPEEKRRTPQKERPDAGKTSKLGRKVETPATIQSAGPSGQRNDTQEQKQHANK